MMKAISKKSRKNARKKMKRLMKIRNPQTPPGSEVKRFSSQTPPEKPRKPTQKQVAQFGNADGFEADPHHSEIGDGEGGLEDDALGHEDADHGADAAGDHADN